MRDGRMRITVSGLAFIAMSLAASPAVASPIYWSRAFANACAGLFCTPIINDTGQIMSSVDTAVTSSTADNLSGSTALATAWVANGSLHSFTTGTAPQFSVAGGTALASFFDTITPTSTTLAFGTPVSIALNPVLTYSLIGGACGGNTGQVLFQLIGGGAVSLGYQVQDSTCDTSDFVAGSLTAQAFIGQEFTIQLNLFTFATGNPGTGTADASNSLNLFMTPLGNFSLVTASGLTYQQQSDVVPEPGSMLLLGTGLAALTLIRRSRSRRS